MSRIPLVNIHLHTRAVGTGQVYLLQAIAHQTKFCLSETHVEDVHVVCHFHLLQLERDWCEHDFRGLLFEAHCSELVHGNNFGGKTEAWY